MARTRRPPAAKPYSAKFKPGSRRFVELKTRELDRARRAAERTAAARTRSISDRRAARARAARIARDIRSYQDHGVSAGTYRRHERDKRYPGVSHAIAAHAARIDREYGNLASGDPYSKYFLAMSHEDQIEVLRENAERHAEWVAAGASGKTGHEFDPIYAYH